jgi:hypothetical protein
MFPSKPGSIATGMVVNHQTRGMLPKIKHKGWNSLTQLVWWSLWKERNKYHRDDPGES